MQIAIQCFQTADVIGMIFPMANGGVSMLRQSRWRFIALAALGFSTVGAYAASGQPACNPDQERDTGRRIKCRMEKLNDRFGALVDTAMQDDTGMFSPAQKQQLAHLKARSASETGRMQPPDFKQLGQNRRPECFVQEILGDVEPGDDGVGGDANGRCDGNEECKGNEDGVCDDDELADGGCAEVLDDGIGDDDGICEMQRGGPNKFDEACIEICDVDMILGESDCTVFTDRQSCNREKLCKWVRDNDTQLEFCEEKNVVRGQADDLETALLDVTDVLDETNVEVASLLMARRHALRASAMTSRAGATSCDPGFCESNVDQSSCEMQSGCLWDVTTSVCEQSPCDRVSCLLDEGRSNTAATIQGVVAAHSAAIAAADACRDAAHFHVITDWSVVCVPVSVVANGLGIYSSTFEVIDDTETSDRVDATARCAQFAGGSIRDVKNLLEDALELLITPHGQRSDSRGAAPRGRTSQDRNARSER